MADKPLPTSQSSPRPERPATGESAALVVGHPKLGQRNSDVRDAMAEMAERAQMISQEAGMKIAAAMKDVIGATAGLAGFAVESARDLVQYMVRRGQITPDEADRLIREAEDAQAKRAPRAKSPPERFTTKSEAAHEPIRREPAKGAATTPTKRSAASMAPTKSEKTKQEKPAKAEKTEEKAAKRPAAQKKATSKATTPKKRR